MKLSKYFPPYFKKGALDKCSLNTSFMNSAGVYIIRKGSEVVYVGFSGTNLYKTMYRHFQTHNDKRQERFIYGKYETTVRIIKCTALQAEKLEKKLILKYKPVDNKMKYENLSLNLPPVNLTEDFNPFPDKQLLTEDFPF